MLCHLLLCTQLSDLNGQSVKRFSFCVVKFSFWLGWCTGPRRGDALRCTAIGIKMGTGIIKAVQKTLCKSEWAGGWHNWWAFLSAWLMWVQKSWSWVSKSAHTLWPGLSTHICELGSDKDIKNEFFTGEISIKKHGRTSLLLPWKRTDSWLNSCKINWTIWHVRSFAFQQTIEFTGRNPTEKAKCAE